MDGFLHFLGMFCLVWVGSGILTFAIGTMLDAYHGIRRDGEWQIGLVICIGGGLILFFIMLGVQFKDWRDERIYQRSKRQ